MAENIPGYAGRLLRLDLTGGRITEDSLDGNTLKKYVGGTGLGAKILYEEVAPEIDWSSPENRLVLASGPLGGTRVGGSGTFSVVTKGALTNGATSSQANGLLGAYLRFNGFEGVIFQGAAKSPVYLYVHDGMAELRDAGHLTGKDVWETEDIIKAEVGKPGREASVFGIGPAGENRVRFATIAGDRGHIAAHNGVGAVLGSKKMKAIAVARRKGNLIFKDRQALDRAAKEILQATLEHPIGNRVSKWGMLTVLKAEKTGYLPVKNYATGVWPIDPDKLAKFGAEYIRANFKPKPHPCWACQFHHAHTLTIPDGPFQGEIVDEPEYECFAAWGPLTGNDDVATTIAISNLVDRLGLDTNEAGFLISMVMECYEKKILTRSELDGLEVTWGNNKAVIALLQKIARREGIGDMLAEGVMRAANRIGGEAPDIGIYTKKGYAPRGHDHRVRWFEMFDTCVSSAGTIETHHDMPRSLLGLPPLTDPFSPEQISRAVADTKGVMQFDDSLGTCRFNTWFNVPLLCKAVNAATGWDLTVDDAIAIGLRAVNLMRAFNLRCGLTAELDAPSPRYASMPTDGKAAGIGIAYHWDYMLSNYYQQMGWDTVTGKPLPDTLERLGLPNVIPQLWG